MPIGSKNVHFAAKSDFVGHLHTCFYCIFTGNFLNFAFIYISNFSFQQFFVNVALKETEHIPDEIKEAMQQNDSYSFEWVQTDTGTAQENSENLNFSDGKIFPEISNLLLNNSSIFSNFLDLQWIDA